MALEYNGLLGELLSIKVISLKYLDTGGVIVTNYIIYFIKQNPLTAAENLSYHTLVSHYSNRSPYYYHNQFYYSI